MFDGQDGGSGGKLMTPPFSAAAKALEKRRGAMQCLSMLDPFNWNQCKVPVKVLFIIGSLGLEKISGPQQFKLLVLMKAAVLATFR